MDLQKNETTALLENFLADVKNLDGPELKTRVTRLEIDFNKMNGDPKRTPGDFAKNILKIRKEEKFK